jgi:hypothetical protein
VIEQRILHGSPQPCLTCDVCKQQIVDLRDCIVVWPERAPEKVRLVHKDRCDRSPRTRCEEADIWLFRAMRSAGFEAQELLARVSLAEGL